MNLRLSTPIADLLRSTLLSLAERLPVLGDELRALRDYAEICDELSRLLRRARKECMVSEGLVDSLKAVLAELDELRAGRELHSVRVAQIGTWTRGGEA